MENDKDKKNNEIEESGDEVAVRRNPNTSLGVFIIAIIGLALLFDKNPDNDILGFLILVIAIFLYGVGQA